MRGLFWFLYCSLLILLSCIVTLYMFSSKGKFYRYDDEIGFLTFTLFLTFFWWFMYLVLPPTYTFFRLYMCFFLPLFLYFIIFKTK